MTMSDDENTVTLDDGTVLVAKQQCDKESCAGCYFFESGDDSLTCEGLSCIGYDRQDGRDIIFVKEGDNNGN